MNDGKPMDIGPVRISENGEGQEILTVSITPRILEHGKFFRDGTASEFYDLRYSQGMNQDSKQYRDLLPISSSNPANTVTFGYWPFGQQSIGLIQAVNLTENQFGRSGTNRPFVQKRMGLVVPNTLHDVYASGIRPLSSALVDAYPGEKPYLLQRYDSVPGLTDEPWTLETRIQPVWEMHQNEKYKKLAIRAAEAVLAKRLARIGNPVVLEHTGELPPSVLPHFLDTVNVLSKAMDPRIATISAIGAASMDNYSNADLVVRDVSIPLTASLYPSYIVNRNSNDGEVLPGHYSTPPFKENSKVAEIYDALHGSVTSWVKNHESILQRN